MFRLEARENGVLDRVIKYSKRWPSHVDLELPLLLSDVQEISENPL